MGFYREFQIQNFKNFKEFQISDLKRINLIIGKNNSGKTSLLEALLLHSGIYQPELILNLFTKHEIPLVLTSAMKNNLELFFHNFNIKEPIYFKAQIQEEKKTVKRKTTIKFLQEEKEIQKTNLRLNIKSDFQATYLNQTSILELIYETDNHSTGYNLIISGNSIDVAPVPQLPPFPANLISSRGKFLTQLKAERFSLLRSEGHHKKIIEALQIIEPKLRSLEVLTLTGLPILYGDIELKKLIPLSLLGEGMESLVNILLSIGVSKGGIVLIDEIENGFHYSILERVWKVILEVAREFEVQIFATTHSYECLESAHNVFKKNEDYEFKLLRIDEVNENLQAVTYDKEILDKAIQERFEVR